MFSDVEIAEELALMRLSGGKHCAAARGAIQVRSQYPPAAGAETGQACACPSPATWRPFEELLRPGWA